MKTYMILFSQFGRKSLNIYSNENIVKKCCRRKEKQNSECILEPMEANRENKGISLLFL
jgi:hypothetical protein